MDELAIRYEYVIRIGHNIGRLEIPAAHADTFRALERHYVENRDRRNGNNDEELLFNYAFYCGEVSSNISHAIFQFEKNFHNNLSDEDRDDLNKIDELLSKAQMEQIDEAIHLIEIVFRRHGKYI
jgi:hypothetical protein